MENSVQTNKKFPFDLREWHELYFEYWSDPTDKRTIKQFAEEAGVTDSAVHQWKKKYRAVIDQEVETRRQEKVPQVRARLWKALDSMLEGNVKAIELGFKLIGDLETTQQHEHAINYMSPDEKRAKLIELVGTAQAKLGILPPKVESSDSK